MPNDKLRTGKIEVTTDKGIFTPTHTEHYCRQFCAVVAGPITSCPFCRGIAGV